MSPTKSSKTDSSPWELRRSSDRGIDPFYEVSKISLFFNILVTSQFTVHPKTHYQDHLLSLILDLEQKGWNTGEISRFLTDKEYLSVRGKPLLSKHIWSMLKKNRKRIERLEEEPEITIESIEIKRTKLT